MMHWNLKTNSDACRHNTEPKAWTTGRVDSGRKLFFVQIGGMSWRWDRYVPTSKRAELIEACFGEWATHYGSVSPVDFSTREARIYMRPDEHARWRGAYRLTVSMIEHDHTCYA